jgi:pimeloyl-[acyl-carrier protein] methyl ester esterase
MRLVFIHGWGLDASLWDPLVAELSDHTHLCLERGFFGQRQLSIVGDEPSILIGHSLGFLYGLSLPIKWQGWVAINSFPRFVIKPNEIGCVPPVALRDMRIRLRANTKKTLADFHAMIGAPRPNSAPNTDALCQGLDELRDLDNNDLTASNVPGLVLASKNDPLVTAETSENLAKNKDILWHQTAGHILPHSDPHFCAIAIKNFLDTHGLTHT